MVNRKEVEVLWNWIKTLEMVLMTLDTNKPSRIKHLLSQL